MRSAVGISVFQGGEDVSDALVAWGDESALRERVDAYQQAGASRVIIMPFDRARRDGRDCLSVLAPN